MRGYSNIIFSNGALDPWRSGAILTNVSDTVISIIIEDSAHHLDLRAPNSKDPASVTAARQWEIETIQLWLAKAIEEKKTFLAYN
jgi:lysosomal Pro-X carboxypeptidase